MEKFGLKLGLSIAEMICCNPVYGLIAVVLIVIANSKFKAGDVEGADIMEKTNTIILIVGAALMLISVILYSCCYSMMLIKVKELY